MRQRRPAKSKSACYPRFIADHVTVELAADGRVRSRRKFDEGKAKGGEGGKRGEREGGGRRKIAENASVTGAGLKVIPGVT